MQIGKLVLVNKYAGLSPWVATILACNNLNETYEDYILVTPPPERGWIITDSFLSDYAHSLPSIVVRETKAWEVRKEEVTPFIHLRKNTKCQH